MKTIALSAIAAKATNCKAVLGNIGGAVSVMGSQQSNQPGTQPEATSHVSDRKQKQHTDPETSLE
eukprot:3427366-Alexandrium_andersonii.AAC.1